MKLVVSCASGVPVTLCHLSPNQHPCSNVWVQNEAMGTPDRVPVVQTEYQSLKKAKNVATAIFDLKSPL